MLTDTLELQFRLRAHRDKQKHVGRFEKGEFISVHLLLKLCPNMILSVTYIRQHSVHTVIQRSLSFNIPGLFQKNTVRITALTTNRESSFPGIYYELASKWFN